MAQLGDTNIYGNLTVTGTTTSSGNFIGNLTGTASKATGDSKGQKITETYIKGLSVNGTTITYTKGDDSTGTITTKDTTYSSKSAASGGTDVSLVTSGEKYTWNNKANAFTVTNGGNTASWGNSVTVGTVAGTALTFKMPANPNTDTHYTAKNVVASKSTGTANVTAATSNPYLNLIENGAVRSTHQIKGNGATKVKTDTSGNIIISSIDTHYTATPVLGATGAVVNATSSVSDPYLNIVENGDKSGGIQIKGSGATSVSAINGIITISSTDTNTTYSSKSAASGGTDVSLVTTGEKYTWNSKANGTHNHTKSQITDFPSSMPASDVYSWAKAKTKPSYAWSEITDKPTSFTPASHSHTKSQITDFPTKMPASDVYDWAKAKTKPAYAWSEITSKPTEFKPESHNHDEYYYRKEKVTEMIQDPTANTPGVCVGYGLDILGGY